MSVHLILNKTHNSEEISVPIATEQTFVEYWLPLAKSNSLDYIIDMHCGYNIDQDALINVVKELEIMLNCIPDAVNIHQDDKDWLIDRINYILGKIKGEITFSKVEGWVG